MTNEYHSPNSAQFLCICARYSKDKQSPYNWRDFAVNTENLIGVECMNCQRLHWKIKSGIKLEYKDVSESELKQLEKLAHNWWKNDSLRNTWLSKRIPHSSSALNIKKDVE